MLSIETSINEIKRNQSGYCLKDCVRTCCNFTTGYLILTHKEAGLLFNKQMDQKLVAATAAVDQSPVDRIEALIKTGALQNHGPDKYCFKGYKCPHYDSDSKQCAIHNDPGRPTACLDFPLYFSGSNVRLDSSCGFIIDRYEDIVDLLETWHKDEVQKYGIRFTLWFEPPDPELCYNGIARDNYDLKTEAEAAQELARFLKQNAG
jgi:Fe-S-cluster containining protein